MLNVVPHVKCRTTCFPPSAGSVPDDDDVIQAEHAADEEAAAAGAAADGVGVGHHAVQEDGAGRPSWPSRPTRPDELGRRGEAGARRALQPERERGERRHDGVRRRLCQEGLQHGTVPTNLVARWDSDMKCSSVCL